MIKQSKIKRRLIFWSAVSAYSLMSIIVISLIHSAFKDTRTQLKAMPKDFLMDVINTQNLMSSFQLGIHEELNSSFISISRKSRNQLERLANRTRLIESSLNRMKIPQETMDLFKEELTYLKANLLQINLVIDDPAGFSKKGIGEVLSTLQMLEDNMTFLFTSGNELVYQQAADQRKVLTTLSNSLSILVAVVLATIGGLVIALRQVYLQKIIMQKFATVDSLTGLKNRRSFDETIAKEFARSRRLNTQLCLIFIDIDYFKSYNDTYGHAEGDKVLAQFAMSLEKNMKRKDDSAFRLGGEEFACIVSSAVGTNVMELPESIRQDIEKLNIPHKGNIREQKLTVSVGVAHMPEPTIQSADELYIMSDKALYVSKDKGRNQVTHANLPGAESKAI